MRKRVIGALVVVAALSVGGCASESIAEDAAIACGWNEPDEPLVLPAEATREQLAENVDKAERRLAAAQRVVASDDRFGALVEALSETEALATRLRDMDAGQIANVSNEEWDYAKYVQFVARDQCEQLAAVVDGS